LKKRYRDTFAINSFTQRVSLYTDITLGKETDYLINLIGSLKIGLDLQPTQQKTLTISNITVR